MESDPNNTPQNNGAQDSEGPGLVVLVTDSFGSTGGDSGTPDDEQAGG